jgi:hypothetical protein
METHCLEFRNGHIFVDLGGGQMLLDTGAPSSFHADACVQLAGRTFDVSSENMGLTPHVLSDLVRTPVTGLLGGDILGEFDWLIDLPEHTLSLSTSELSLEGKAHEIRDFMGIPILDVQICERTFAMFFDTGAQLSYLEDDLLSEFPCLGEAEDFYPGFGKFKTQIHRVLLRLGRAETALRFGRLPSLLGMTLLFAGTNGIIGNEILENRRVGFFPRRRALIIGARSRSISAHLVSS